MAEYIKEVTAKVNDGKGISILADDGSFKSTYDILYEISEVWDKIDSNSQSALLERMAGKHRATVVAALLSDSERLKEALDIANDSAGSALTEWEKRTQSIEHALGSLNAAWQEFSMNTVPKEWIVWTINLAQTLLELASQAGAFKIIGASLGTLAGIGATTKVVPYLSNVGKQYENDSYSSFIGPPTKEQYEGRNKLKSSLKEIKKIATDSNYVADIFEKKWTSAASTASSAFIGLGKTISVVGKAIMKSFVIGIVITGVVELVSRLTQAYFNQKNEVSNLSTEVDNLTSSISDLNAEKRELESKDVQTTADKRRLKELEQEIELEERLLEIKKEELTDTFKDNSNNYFSEKNGIIKSSFYDAQTAADDSLSEYEKAIAKVERHQKTVDMYAEQLSKYDFGSKEYERYSNLLDEASQKLRESKSEVTSVLETMGESLTSLREEYSYYEDAIDAATGKEREQLLQERALTDEKIRAMEVALGLVSTQEDYAEEISKLSGEISKSKSKVNDLTKVFDEAQKTQKISEEQMMQLRSKYPSVAVEIEKAAKKIEGGYELEEAALGSLRLACGEAQREQIQTEISRTQVVLEQTGERIRMYEIESAALADLIKAQYLAFTSQGENKYGNDLAMDGMGYNPYTDQDAEAQQYLKDLQEYNRTQKELAKLQAELSELDASLGNVGSGDISSSGSNSGSGSSKSADVWDKYAHALAKANDEIERYNRVCEITQAKLDNNQSIEERNLDLISQEIQLYDELIANTQAKYKIVNDTLWAQQQGLQQLYSEASKHMGISAEEVAGLTDAELEAFIELKLDEDKANDQKIAHLLNGIVDMRQNVHDLHIDWLALKSDILELKNEQINVRVNFQNDIAEKFDEARVNSESLLDILEEMEGTEGQRLSIIESLINSYDTELNSTMQMYKSTGEELANMLKDGLIDTDQYNNLLKEANRLEEHGLEVIKEQHDMRLKQLEVEKQRAIANAEASIYGEEGQDAWEKSRQREIDRLQNQLEALEEDASEADYLEQLSEKEEHIAELEEKLANLRNQKTIQQLKQQEDGSFQWEYIEDQRAINETMEELEDARNDLQKTKDDKALQDQKDAIQDRIDSIEDEIDSKQEQYDLELEQINAHYEAQKAAQEQFTQEQIDLWLKHVTDVRQALDTLETQTRKGLDEVTSETAKGMSNLQDAYNESFINITSDLSSFVDAAIREFNRLEAARRAAAEEARAMTEGAVGGSTSSPPKAAGGIKFVEANNFLARLHYGERVLTRQEASQYNELEDDIKSGKLQSYFDSLQEDTALSISNVAATSVEKSATVPTVGSAVTSFVIEHLELPQVKDPTDFAAVINEWARGEFGGLAQKARIIPAR